MKYCSTPIWTASMQDTHNTELQQLNTQILKVGIWMMQPVLKTAGQVPIKLNRLSRIQSSTTLNGIYPKELKVCSYKIPHTDTYRGCFPNCSTLKVIPFWDRVFLRSLGCPVTYYIDHASPKLSRIYLPLLSNCTSNPMRFYSGLKTFTIKLWNKVEETSITEWMKPIYYMKWHVRKDKMM